MNAARKFALAALALLGLSAASAPAGVFVGVGVPGPYYRPYYRPYWGPRVVVGLPPVYIGPAPAPVYVQPAPVYVQTAPAVIPAPPAPYAPPPQAAPAPPVAPTPTDTLAPGAVPKLVVLRGQRINIEYPLYEGENYVGRADEKAVDIDLEDQEAPERIWSSRQHALITFEDGSLAIEDLNSTNGTFVNRNRIHPGQKRPLQVNDVVMIGTVQMRVIV